MTLDNNKGKGDVIAPEVAATIPELFAERVRRSPNKTAYSQFDSTRNKWLHSTWQEMSESVMQWRNAAAGEGFKVGERAAIRVSNSKEWVIFDQVALAQGLVVVPVYVEDRPDNIAYILAHTQARWLVLEEYTQWLEMEAEIPSLTALKRVIIVNDNPEIENCTDERVMSLHRWLASAPALQPQALAIKSGDLATIVYTSGTTGKPKGVMLSHSNMLLNAYAGLQSLSVYQSDRFISFLPLSHMFERTVGYYLTMMAGAEVAFNRSMPDLLDDIATVKPTIMVTVPRIFERVYAKIKTQLDEGSGLKKWLFEQTVAVGWHCFEHQQGRATWHIKQCFWRPLNALVANKVVQLFGGQLRFAACGGARLSPNLSKVFIGLGIRILQGYGLTESSPILTVNTLSRNKPSSIGLPLQGVTLRLGDNNELQAQGHCIMMGYWDNPQATAEVIDSEGWLMTGDVADIADDGFITITGRIKEIIVLANGEKMPPADMEAAIIDNPLFEQAMVIGEGRAYLTALVVLNSELWHKAAIALDVDADDKKTLEDPQVKQFMLDKIAQQLTQFPGYAFIRQITLSNDVWSVSDGAITPTLKLKRAVLMQRFETDIELMYSEHG